MTDETWFCAHCGDPFPARKPARNMPRQRYCSQRCKRRANTRRWRRRAAADPSYNPERLAKSVPEPPEREGVPFPLTRRLPGSYETGKRR